MTDPEGIVDFDDAARIGFKVVEMADRVRVVDKVTPGAQAKWGFEIDDIAYDVVITVRRDG